MRWQAVRLAWASARVAASLLGLVNALSAALLVTYIYFSGGLLAAIPAAARGGWGSSAGGQVQGYLVATGLCFLGMQLAAPVRTRLSGLVTRQVDGAVRDRLAASSVRAPGLAPFEDQELLRELDIAKNGLDEGQRTPGQAVTGLATLFGLYTQAFLAATLIAVLLSPLFGFGLLAAGALVRRSHRTGLVLESRARAQDQDMTREVGYYRQVALDGPAGREIRVFGLSGWLRGRFRLISVRSLEASMAVRRQVHGNRFIPPVLIATAVGVLSILWIAGHASAGSLSVRDLVISLQAGYVCLQIGNYFREDWQTQWGLVAHQALDAFEAGMTSLASKDPVSRWQGTRDPSGMPRESLRFAAVTFAYPGTDRLIFDRLSLDLTAGRSVAIVGLNGAGKTTLVKLLAGLYQPSSGSILVDGTDLRELRLVAWQQNVAAIYQDFERYQLSVAENIAFGDAARPQMLADIKWAAQQAGILGFLETLPRGLDTPLAAGYTHGTDLSGGQWQRVALARAFYALRKGAGVLVLDEPTASLDVRSEATFLDQFLELTRGVTTVVISHRFATIRHADWIVVLDSGRVIEEGTHESLLAAGGRYAELFLLQAGRFTEPDAGQELEGPELPQAPEPERAVE
jgi:ATP-binding cassette, subfamily B, bacterial